MQWQGGQSFPAEFHALSMYLAFLTQCLSSSDYVRNYISSSHTVHKILGLNSSAFKEPLLQLLLRGAKRVMQDKVTQATPMTLMVLSQILQQVDVSDDEQLVALCALLVGFYLFLRKSNLVPDLRQNVHTTRLILRDDIKFTDQDVLVNIKWSRTNQYQERVVWVPLIGKTSTDICPVYWLTRMLAMTRVPLGHPLFSFQRNRMFVPLTYSRLQGWLKRWTSVLHTKGHYTLHSLRHGGATWAHTVGISSDAIKQMGPQFGF